VIQRAAFDFMHPFSAVENYGGHGEVRGGYLAVGPQNVMAATLKQAEDGNGLVLRLYEVEGRDTEALITLHPDLWGPNTEVWLADVHEAPLQRIERPASKGAVRVPVKAHTVVTVRLLENG